jgi:uncharacterized protein YjiS (DUF1127 family)
MIENKKRFMNELQKMDTLTDQLRDILTPQ